ncbi:uncharacterized protein LOC111989276 isoform X2 [Quercus suber]|uniref:Uncharacterized protein n=1 Tax=Quercus suber TaxID=58331 RepID=A0AAW0KYN4_QUESU|nr:uncharacterized protein LOC111989276 isoform X2 [Quercus suber]POE80613.1 hypothetical protein CFP56_15019 [Quercus suber]
MNREQKRRRFNEALVNMLYPQPPPSPPPEEEEEKPVKLLEEEFAVDLSSDDLEKSGCSTSDDNDDSESGTQKLTRAQRKRLRKKMLKEDASRRGKMIGPLLPSTKEVGDDGCTGGVRQNAAVNVDAASDESEQPACANQKKRKHRRMAKRLAKERCKIADVEHCDPK